MSAKAVAQSSGDQRVEGHLHDNGVGVITLARPEALNAADEAMVLAVDRLLTAFSVEEACRAVLLEGSTPRAFCSGGDVKKIALQLQQCKDGGGSVVAATALAAEYNLITRIARMRKPLVALMDGVTMGFGLGMSGHARYRVVTENTNAAMPEVRHAKSHNYPYVHIAHTLRLPPSLALLPLGACDLSLTGSNPSPSLPHRTSSACCQTWRSRTWRSAHRPLWDCGWRSQAHVYATRRTCYTRDWARTMCPPATSPHFARRCCA